MPGEHRMVAVLSNGLYKIAPDVTEPSEYHAFYRDYYAGHWLTMDLYILTESEAAKCPDEGRVPV